MRPVLRAAIVAAVANALLAPLIAWRGGAAGVGLLGLNACFGALVGVVTAAAIGWAIRRLHGVGCISAIAVAIGLPVLATWLAAPGGQVGASVTAAALFPLWCCAAAITGIMVKPVHPDR